MEWKIYDKNPAIVTDNARNMIVAGAEAQFSPHITCFAHTLNLASQKAKLLKHLQPCEDDSTLVAEIKRVMASDLSTCYRGTQDALNIAYEICSSTKQYNIRAG
ncbi:hypothetical protein J4Q44_G00266630 [Coregonus suidteri]|uniref:Uncharacterized protein n=1 Tax=Coregonus suidteri TaxID=861788 RepID=A0AAN8L270_9TELE